MVKFSMAEEVSEDEGPSRPTPKRQRMTPPPTPRPSPPPEVPEEEEEEEEDDDEEERQEYESEQVRSESEQEYHDDEVESDPDPLGHFESDPKNRSSLEPNRDGSISVTLTDPDVLDCPICFDTLTIPVFQCENGHLACSPCCIKLRNKCPSCSLPIGYNRCRGVEKVLESVKISCRNLKYGCVEIMSYSKKHEHEDSCIHAPCSCPLPDCNFVGSFQELSLHFGTQHVHSAKPFIYNYPFSISLNTDQKYIILREREEGVVFILNNVKEIAGSFVCVNCNCIAPRSLKRRVSYDLEVKKGLSSLRLRSCTENMPRWREHVPEKEFLLIPSDFICGQLKLDLCIRAPTAQ